ncbi:response regulator transcription factor [Novosphingobium marinum]|uniref:response regulator transcription factor n=1 Tax=Novosphingobium marinum TaxID=1514948 RepID=UPI0035712ACD
MSTKESRLSSREFDCLKLMAAGNCDRETSEMLAITSTTVRFHLRNAMTKLETRNRCATGRVHRRARGNDLG